MNQENKVLATESFILRWRDRRREQNKTLMLVLVTIMLGVTTLLSIYMFLRHFSV